VRGIVVGLALAAFIFACAPPGPAMPPGWQRRMEKMNEITALWIQIRDFRREAGMELDPSPRTEMQLRTKTVKEAKRVCAEGHLVPATCGDMCNLAEHICDSAESICIIADELGKNDPAQEKCTSAKASCREAKQRCCNCSANPPPAVVLPPASNAPAPPAASKIPTP